MPRRPTTTDLYAYLDYRAFLRDTWAELQASSRKYSYRWFARRAGLGSPSYLKAVIEGERNLRQETARRFAEALQLGRQETEFFLALVAMNQADTTAARAHHYERLSRFPRYRRTRTLERADYDYHQRWYNVAIRELAARADFREDPAWIAAQLRPTITPAQAAEGLALLERLGLLVRDETGVLRQADPLLSTGRQVRTLAMRRFHAEMLGLAGDALDRVDVDHRHVGGVTVRLTRAQYEHLTERLYELRQEVLQLDGADPGSQAVHHFAFQLVPLTRPGPEEP